ncbi:Mediator complex subunit 10 CG5057-PA [Zea mays]|uniref:Mediator complex subunit 10 CG5057-PA n=1 Tax=Zea mays TaxID=4577 RepID=A0A1D6I9F5_MAIZE|nr:Mediator complex subunit 10 CG5057-PA [Zea mays]
MQKLAEGCNIQVPMEFDRRWEEPRRVY